MSLMVSQAILRAKGAAPEVVLDLGYLAEVATRERADALRAWGLGAKNFSVEGFSRLLVRIPPAKLQALLAAFPVEDRSTYYGATHNWLAASVEAAKEEADSGSG